MCQSVALPSSAEYSHIGAMIMRLERASWPRCQGVNSSLTCDLTIVGAADLVADRTA